MTRKDEHFGRVIVPYKTEMFSFTSPPMITNFKSSKLLHRRLSGKGSLHFKILLFFLFSVF
jgi:hypothetical protein